MNEAQANRVLRVLVAGFPSYPVAEDTARLYQKALMAEVEDGSLALEVAVDWAWHRLTFPKVAELVAECQSESTRRLRAARARAVAQAKAVEGMVACRRCDDTRMIDTKTADGVFASPCPDCDPKEAQYWADGHYDKDHPLEACSHARCKDRAKHITRIR